MTRKTLIIGICALSGLWGCNNLKNRAQLQTKIDSLQAELKSNQDFVSTLNQVGTMIDSIDASRKAINTNMVEGTSYDDYATRLAGINQYVKDTEAKLHSLEKSASSKFSYYSSTLKKMKNDLDDSKSQIATLQDQLSKAQTENSSLAFTVDQQKQTLAQRLDSLNARDASISQLKTQIDHMQVASQSSKADLYYQCAVAKEQAANRTHFAWKKKKQTQQQALELYQMAYQLGKTEAQPKIDQLEKEIG